MKLLAILILLYSLNLQASPCDDLIKITHEMNFIASNIANVETTRTPEGGAYQPFVEKSCSGLACELVKTRQVYWKFEPSHIDANEEGYVEYPEIRREQEMDKLKQAKFRYETATTLCRGKKAATPNREPGHSWQAFIR